MGKSSNTREEKKDLLPAAAAAAAAASTIRVEHEPASLTQSAAESTSRVDPEPSLTPSAAALGRPKWSPLPAPRPLILLYVGITEDGGGGAELSVEKEFDVMEQAWNQTLGMQQKCLQFIRRFSRPADLVAYCCGQTCCCYCISSLCHMLSAVASRIVVRGPFVAIVSLL
jgi:hypothetical protein